MDNDCNTKDTRMVVGQLESKVDFLETELSYLDHLLQKVGFPRGIETLKATAEELLSSGMFNYIEKPHPEGY